MRSFECDILKKIQCVRKVAVHSGYGTYVDLIVSIEVAVAVCFVSLYSVVKQRLKCNTGKVCNCSIQVLLTMDLSIDFEHLS
jgi:hypothetical protein